ncbi:MAG: ThiF family adenylyltransferase [Gammaproteobacteria bacterium]
MSFQFNYEEAFSRNIGWVTEREQQILRGKTIAIAGMGGVGGIHLLTLARLGVGAFHIADLDTFEIANFNRQVGATMSALGRPKVEVLTEMAKDINPEINIKSFPSGIDEYNLSEFFTGVDLYVDGLDFFAFSARQATFAACARLGIPAITVAPLGMGAALLNFLPGKMTFEEYFCLNDRPEEEKALRFMLGLAPARLQLGYLADPTRVDLAQHRGPSTIMACQLCAGVAATEALKILLNRGKVIAAPHGLHFDAYRYKMARTWRPGGNNNPMQRLALSIAKRYLSKQTCPVPTKSPEVTESAPQSVIETILDLARWAPSGDNTQPWRFEIVSDHQLMVHGFDTRDYCVYDLDGHPSQIALGALLETISIAATGHGLRASIQRRVDLPETTPTFDVSFEPDPQIQPDPLIPFIPKRSVQRRPMQTRALTPQEKRTLEAAVGGTFRILWLEGFGNKWRTARLMFANAELRLTMREAYEVHRSVIQWNARFSEDKVPDQAIGLDPLTTRLMGWVMQSWKRVEFFNAFLAGTLAPRIQLDLIPGIACAAHFAILAHKAPEKIDDYVAAGRAVQRFWLTATSLGLQLQPEMTPLIFSRYARNGLKFTGDDSIKNKAGQLAAELNNLLSPSPASRATFMGRIGAGPAAQARSLRLSVARLMTRG